MGAKEVEKSLEFLGLSEKESAIYLFVCTHPGTTGGRIIKVLKIARSKTYDALEKLVSMGLLEKDESGVAKYTSAGRESLESIYRSKVEEVGKAIQYIIRKGTGGVSVN
ncbi:hypothetical protein GF412_05080 [Candidatus Micrarchaeota archaeon]|nr:hypothetical protein [Candidatus Micrarchaeota archaeon]MBD3418327.1 hypothetical protein [Candidatus Micrarchaeota archaeon]